MYDIQPLSVDYIFNIIEWNKGCSKDFLIQWTGRGYEYPITVEQIKERMENGGSLFQIIFKDEMIGTIEIMNIDYEKNEAFLGRYLLNPNLRGQGHGTTIMKAFTTYCFQTFDIQRIKIRAFDYNKGAIECYKKVGYTIAQEIKTEDNGVVYEMVLNNNCY